MIDATSLTPREISLIITAHRAGPMLERCLNAVASMIPAPGEVIVMVDGGCAEVVAASRKYNFVVLPLAPAPGVSAARNAGAARAKGQVLAFLDSDVEASPDFVSRGLAVLNDNAGAQAAFGSYDAAPAAPGLVSRYRNLLHHFTHQTGSREARTFWAACGVCRKAAFQQAGGFDVAYRQPSIEDIELGYRLRHAGHRIVLDPTWQIRHLKAWSLREVVATDCWRRAFPWTLLLLREGRMDNDLNIDTRSRWSALLCGLALVALTLALVFPGWLALATVCLGAVIALNRRFYGFLARCQGRPFMLACIPLHMLYFLTAMAGYAMGFMVFELERARKALSQARMPS